MVAAGLRPTCVPPISLGWCRDPVLLCKFRHPVDTAEHMLVRRLCDLKAEIPLPAPSWGHLHSKPRPHPTARRGSTVGDFSVQVFRTGLTPMAVTSQRPCSDQVAWNCGGPGAGRCSQCSYGFTLAGLLPRWEAPGRMKTPSSVLHKGLCLSGLSNLAPDSSAAG